MASVREFRSQVAGNNSQSGPQESLPFLNAVENDSDIELQAVGQDQEYDDFDDPRIPPIIDARGRSEQRDSYENDTFLPASLVTPRHRKSIFQRLYSYWLCGRISWSSSTRKKPHLERKARRIRPLTVLLRIIAILIMFLGLIQLGTLALGVLSAFYPEKLDHAFRTWRHDEDLNGLSHWPTDYTADIIPAACHSHNDYWRRVPLISAIQAGCTGVEADVWLFKDDLYVGHAESALAPDRTLSTLYIDPLVEILERQNPITEFQSSVRTHRNGVFDTDPSQTLILLIDFKTDYRTLWPVVTQQLEPLRKRQYLTHFNGTAIIQGPITVVVTGNAPFDYVVANMKYRDMFFDAPLDMMTSLADTPSLPAYDPSIEFEYLAAIETSARLNFTDQNQGQGRSGHPPTNPTIFSLANSYYASVDFKASIGWPRPYLSSAQRDKIVTQIAGAHSRGLKVRYWGVPNWPVGLRNYLWRELVKMGVDYLNVDDLYAATQGDWRSGYSVWDWSLWGGDHW